MLKSLFNKVVAWRSATLLKRDSTHFFSLTFAKFLKTPILKSICKRLLLFTSLLNNISYFRVKIKKTDTLKICRYPEFNIKLIILQWQHLKSSYNTIKFLVATFSKTTGLSSTKNVKMYLSKVWAFHSNFHSWRRYNDANISNF